MDFPDVIERLGRNWFWCFIATLNGNSFEDPDVRERFAALSHRELVAVEWHVRSLVRELGTAQIYGALYQASGGKGLSDDQFEYMRYWIVFQGEAVFRETSRAPDYLAKFLEEPCEEATDEWWSRGEDLGYAISSEVESRGHSIDELESLVGLRRGDSIEKFDWRDAIQLNFQQIEHKCVGSKK